MSVEVTRAQLLAMIAGGALAFGVIAITPLMLMPSREELSGLQKQGQTLVEELGRYKGENGAYPASLPKAKRDAGRFGEWEYECVRQCAEFRLGMGYSLRHLFGLWYDSRIGEWELDT